MKLNKLPPATQNKIYEIVNLHLWTICYDLKDWGIVERNSRAYQEMLGWEEALREMVKDLKSETDCCRPKTLGELRDKLSKGVDCEAVPYVSEMAEAIFRRWLEFKDSDIEDSESGG